MAHSQEFFSASSEETIAFAKKFAASLKPGNVVRLEGNLGSGKTTFIKGIALGLGLADPDQVKSPTFALMHVYPTVPPLYHFDLYRLATIGEIQNIGLEEFASDPSAVTCIEWAEKAAGLLPRTARRVRLETAGPQARRILILGDPR